MQSLLLDTTFGANDRGIIVFGFEIYYYALCIVCGMLIASALSALLMKRRNMSPDFVFTLFVFCIPSALICARLFYCITDAMPITQWLNVRDGGLSIIGGVIGGVGAGLIVCLVKKVDFFRAADCVVINILLAQAMGRWGNFFNGEVYGGVVTDPSMQWFPFAVPISNAYPSGLGGFRDPNATWHYAFFFYEMIFNLIGFAILFTVAWRRKSKPNGLLTFAYFVWYGVVRAIMEPLRDPRFILSGGEVPWSEVFSILMIVFGAIGIMVLLILNYRKEGSFFGSRKGDPCGITAYLTPYKDDKPYFSKINMLGANYPPKPPKEKGSSKQTPPVAEANSEGDAPEAETKPKEEKPEGEETPPSGNSEKEEKP